MNIRALGLVTGYLLSGAITTYALAPTDILWNASTCKTGVATVTTTLTDPNGNTYKIIDEGVNLPQVSFRQSFGNLPPTTYFAKAIVEYADGSLATSEYQNIVGLGDAPIPVPPQPNPNPDPTPTPTPDPNPQSPLVITSPLPGGIAHGLIDVVVTIPVGPTSTLSVKVFNVNDVEKLSSGQVSAPGNVSSLKVPLDLTSLPDGTYKMVAYFGPWISSPTGFMVGTNTNPNPAPTDTTLIIKTVKDGDDAILNQLLPMSTTVNEILKLVQPIPTITCTITAVGSYAGGDQKLTVRCAPSGFATGQVIQIIKK